LRAACTPAVGEFDDGRRDGRGAGSSGGADAPVTTYGSKSRTRATPGAGRHPRDGRPHGLDIVQAIAGDGNWGIDGGAALGRVAWARLDWPNR